MGRHRHSICRSEGPPQLPVEREGALRGLCSCRETPAMWGVQSPVREADASHSISLVAWLERKVERVQSIVEPVQKRSCFDIGKQRSWRRRQNPNRAVVLAEPVQ
jgi:hypothetical protein